MLSVLGKVVSPAKSFRTQNRKCICNNTEIFCHSMTYVFHNGEWALCVGFALIQLGLWINNYINSHYDSRSGNIPVCQILELILKASVLVII